MFKRLLVANRGEIACRVMRTARRMGLRAIGIYSEADAGALHMRLVDEAWPIGASSPAESYLSVDRIIEAARRSRADAIHPGYGFLSESPVFAERCETEGLVFVGPSARTMRLIGGKASAKTLVAGIGVPTIPGFSNVCRDAAAFADAAHSLGYPVVVKASAGGGGRGMRVVDSPEALPGAVEAASREARLAFGDDRLILEKYLARPRHVEVQIFADRFGEIVTFPERDCSLQRRHQKLVEETPAPGLSTKKREALAADAREIARASEYLGAGTVEFLVEGGDHYFLEVNARLQVEHPVSEMLCGVDLVEWQLRVACGEPLPAKQSELRPRGWAMEARICAEDPDEDFRPSSGVLTHVRFPHEGVRVETGVETGSVISPFYDALLAKLVVWSEDRAGALRKLQMALDGVELIGTATNLEFLRALLRDDRFSLGEADTRIAETVARRLPPPEADFVFVAAAGAAGWRKAATDAARRAEKSPWTAADGWRLYGSPIETLTFRCGDRTLLCRLGIVGATRFWMDYENQRRQIDVLEGQDSLILAVDGVTRQLTVIAAGNRCVVICEGRNYVLERIDLLSHSIGNRVESNAFVAPLPARVTRILVESGEHVAKGAPILILEAMKMEIPMNAPYAGAIESVLCNEGQSVCEGETLVKMASQ
jgi:3-methylcrotonyl-CoA carboxylase alpha subunit